MKQLAAATYRELRRMLRHAERSNPAIYAGQIDRAWQYIYRQFGYCDALRAANQYRDWQGIPVRPVERERATLAKSTTFRAWAAKHYHAGEPSKYTIPLWSAMRQR